MTSVAHDERRDLALGRRASRWLPALAVFGFGLVAWQWILPALGVERFLLPPFSDVLTRLLGRS